MCVNALLVRPVATRSRLKLIRCSGLIILRTSRGAVSTRASSTAARRTVIKGVQDHSVVRWEAVDREAVGGREGRKRRGRGQTLATSVRRRMWGTIRLLARRRLQWRVSVPVGSGGVLVLRRVLRVPSHLVVRGERRVVVLTVHVFDHSTLRRIRHRERISPILVVFHPRL